MKEFEERNFSGKTSSFLTINKRSYFELCDLGVLCGREALQPPRNASWALDNLKAAAHILVFEATQLTSNPPRSSRFHGHGNQE